MNSKACLLVLIDRPNPFPRRSINQQPTDLPSCAMTDSTEENCPFCDIVKAYPHPYTPQPAPHGTDPLAHIVYSTAHTIAFLDRLPLTKAHTLLIPRSHHESISSTPASIAAELGRALPVVCRAATQVAGADAFNVVQNNGPPNSPPSPQGLFRRGG
jgi:diadenosine tetraphosphate (Ap4A) HIT family hydrolase